MAISVLLKLPLLIFISMHTYTCLCGIFLQERWTSTPNAATDKSRIPLHTPIQTQNLSSVQPRPSFSDSGTSSSSSEDEQAVKKTKNKKLKLLKVL